MSKPKTFTMAPPEADAVQFICFIHGVQAGERCPECPKGLTMSSTAGALVESYLGNRSLAIGAIRDALQEFASHNDRSAFRYLDRAAPYLLTLKAALVNQSFLDRQADV